MKTFEAELGFKLFSRERQRLKIAEAGRDYLMVPPPSGCYGKWAGSHRSSQRQPGSPRRARSRTACRVTPKAAAAS